jgi:2-polyprenyl-6-methoxyphenol hydroxylase-like FAD-dependent oxidoreductase
VLDVRYDALRGGRFGLAVHRAALFEVLYGAARRDGVRIETGIELDALDTTGERAVLDVKSGRRLGGFDLVIDATGARSKLKRHAARPSEPWPLAYGAFWASLPWRGVGFDEHALSQRYDRASVMIGVLPIGRPAANAEPTAAFFWSLKPAEAEAVRAQGIDAWKARVAGLWPECRPFLDQLHQFDQLTLARYGHHTLAKPAGRRLAVIGDAAHSTSPQLGQGANMALLDVQALAHSLSTRPTLDEALEAYVRMRRWHVRTFQALSLMFTPFYQSDSAMLPFIRDRLVATVARIPPAPQVLAAMVAGTIVDPFKAIGLKEVDWSTLPAPPVTAMVTG